MGVEPASILGVLSLIFWTIMALVTLKYVAIIMRADNRGEGGSLALLARVTELTKLYFIWMLRNAQSATDFFRIPTNCVVELGTLVEI